MNYVVAAGNIPLRARSTANPGEWPTTGLARLQNPVKWPTA